MLSLNNFKPCSPYGGGKVSKYSSTVSTRNFFDELS